MKTITEVKNLITGKIETYSNSLGTQENLITSILFLQGRGSQVHNKTMRKEAEKLTELIHSKNGSQFHYCQQYDLTSKTISNI